MTASYLDLVLLAVMVLFGLNGYLRGFVVGVLSFIGFTGGALLGLQLAPLLANRITDVVWRLVIALVTVLLVALSGQALANILGSIVREKLKSRRIRVVDNVAGAVLSVIAVLVVGWMIAVPLGTAPLPGVSAQVRDSAIIPVVNKVIPAPAQKVYASFARSLAARDVPELFAPLTMSKLPAVPAPNPALTRSPAVQAARASVLKVEGQAPACDLQLDGSSFVVSPQHVLTNAHVVAGVTADLHVVTPDGVRMPAQVVRFDAERDLAVLYVPRLTAPPLVFVPNAANGADAIVLGYPMNGPYTATAARVRDRRSVPEFNLYKQKTVVREIYTLRTSVHTGNSGGPLIASDGRVYGVLFAMSQEDPETGFALTAAEINPALVARDSTTPVGTGKCVMRS
ncbi:MarP family serine protease [Fodinicola acaciae]|uniref:MarP family serine protease n=1 Tax=Fodinicola acaciae TaxID=2681555 RepID=UPI0013D72176|nr:MarP family serine protease [Fodinicola acaciae]